MARKTAADVAIEALGERFDRMRQRTKEREEESAARALVAHAMSIAEELDVPFVEAYGQARAIAEMRRLDDERRRTHENCYLWCMPDECPEAARLRPDWFDDDDEEGSGPVVSMGTETEWTLRARLAAQTSWANTTDRAARTAPARKALLDQFEHEVDPDGIFDPAERALRAAHARKAHMYRLALKSAQARRARSDGDR